MRNKKIAALTVSAIAAMTMTATVPQIVANADNPIVQTSFTPDPAPVVIGDEFLLHDRLAVLLHKGHEELDRPRKNT